jgi:hypothetical protein
MADYKPDLPEDMKGLSINTDHADYKALEALAREENWTQKSFSRVLGLEAKRVMAPKPAASAPAAPAPAPKPDFSKMSARDQIAHALANSPGRKPLR